MSKSSQFYYTHFILFYLTMDGRAESLLRYETPISAVGLCGACGPFVPGHGCSGPRSWLTSSSLKGGYGTSGFNMSCLWKALGMDWYSSISSVQTCWSVYPNNPPEMPAVFQEIPCSWAKPIVWMPLDVSWGAALKPSQKEETDTDPKRLENWGRKL